MSDSNKKARYHEVRDTHFFQRQQPLGGGGLPTPRALAPPPGPEREESNVRFLGLADLFREGESLPANHSRAASSSSMMVADTVATGKSPSHAWFRGYGSSSRKAAFFTLRIEYRTDDEQGEEERILLFRSDQRGAIGKVVYSSCENAGRQRTAVDTSTAAECCSVETRIKVLAIKEAYRGFDLGSLLVSLAAEKIIWNSTYRSNYPRCNQRIRLRLDAEEESQRHNRLVSFYRRQGFAKRLDCKESYLNSNNGDAIRKVPMERILHQQDGAFHHLQNDCISLLDASAAFLPVSLWVRTGTRIVPVRCARREKTSLLPLLDRWLLVSKPDRKGMVCFLSTVGRALTASDLIPTSEVLERRESDHSVVDEPLWFTLVRTIQDPSDGGTSCLWQFLTPSGSFLACDPYRTSLVGSNIAALWESDASTLRLVCRLDDTMSLREHYRQSWNSQTISFVQLLRDRYLCFLLRPMTLREALQMADFLPADPFVRSGVVNGSGRCSLRSLCFYSAELVQQHGHPDWLQILALIYHLGRLVRVLEEDNRVLLQAENGEATYDWTPAVESRVVGCPDPPSAKGYDLRPPFDDTDDRDDEDGGGCYGSQGMYSPSCGFDQALLTFTGPEYMYHFLKYNQAQIPEDGLKMLRLASLVDWHSRGAYRGIANDDDKDVQSLAVDFNEMLTRAYWETTAITGMNQLTSDDCEELWSETYSDIASKYGLDALLKW